MEKRPLHVAALVCAGWCVAGIAPAADGQLPAERYELKQTMPSTGTRLLRAAAISESLPFNRRYGEMTGEQQAAVRAQYVDMASDDEPPFPVDGLEPIVRVIVQAQDKLQAVGPMTLVVDVDADGKPTAVAAYLSPDDRATTFVSRLLLVQRYKPARCAGQPCAMAFPFRFTFKVR